MVASFYIHLLSNTKSVQGNKTSAFKVRLPKKLEFTSTWRVALVNMIYPYSWPNLGTDNAQHMDIEWHDGSVTRLRVPAKGYTSLDDVVGAIREALNTWRSNLCVVRQPYAIQQQQQLGAEAATSGGGGVDEAAPAMKRARRDAPPSTTTTTTPAPAGEDKAVAGENFPPAVTVSLEPGEGATEMERRQFKTLQQLRAIVRAEFGRAEQMKHEISQKQARIDLLQRDNEEVATLREQVKQLQKQQVTTKATLDAANNILIDKQQRIKDLKARVTTLEDTVSKGEATAQQLKDALQEIDRHQASIKDLEKEKQRLEGNVNKAFQHHEQKTMELKTRTSELTRAEDRVSQLETSIQELTELKNALEDKHRRTLEQVTALNAQLEELGDARREDENTIRELRERIKTLEAEKTTVAQSATTRRNALEQQLREMREDLARVENSLRTYENKTIEYAETIRSLEQRLLTGRAEVMRGKDVQQKEVEDTDVGCVDVADERYATVTNHISITHDVERGRVRVWFDANVIREIRLSDQLQDVLGFERPTLGKAENWAHYMPDLQGGVHSLFVYAPGLVEPTMLGDTTAPLLRVAKVKGVEGEMVEDSFVAPQYHKILEKSVNEISIEIRTVTGRLVPFNWGECILVLHFRKDSII